MRISKLCVLVVIVGISFFALAGCSTASSSQPGSQTGSEQALLPDFVLNAPPTVREAYDYAVKHPDELAKYPCFCGCGKMGHTSNLSCYVKNDSTPDNLMYDNHASGCGICVDITRDVMRLKAEGRSSKDVRAYIDATYGAFGPSTNTPLPLD